MTQPSKPEEQKEPTAAESVAPDDGSPAEVEDESIDAAVDSDDADDDEELDAELQESDDDDDEEEDEDEAVDIDAPDEDSPALRHDDYLDPEERAALEAAADGLDEEEEDEVEPDIVSAAIPRSRLDSDALKVLRRLRRFEHEAYLVGGCVRDLLLGLHPKDFDVATSARPEETRDAFRNCRLIGRRFRLAHIYFKGGKVVETATFRAPPHEDEAPEGDDLYIERDNVYGTAEQDARRRDFTINGLFYDAATGQVIDYVEGRADLEARMVRTIGDPDVRMREDPVRILRAIRFAAKLDFAIESGTLDAMKAHVGDLTKCSAPRVLEEILRLLRCGASRGAFVLLHEVGALAVLMPPLAEYLDGGDAEAFGRFFAVLDAMDEHTHAAGSPPDDAVLLAAVLSTLFEEGDLPTSRSQELDDLLENLVRDTRLPKRKVERVRLMLGAQRIFQGQKKRRFSVSRFVRQSYVSDALLLFEIRIRALGEGAEHLAGWRRRIEEASSGRGGERRGSGGRRRRGRRRRRKPSAER